MKILKLSLQIKERLDRLGKPVGVLTYSGLNINDLAGRKFVAVVGTRKPTGYGSMMTEKLTTALAREGVVIVSGLALGIDSLAHKYCLEVGGKTVAVLPSGINNVYPATHRKLAEKIVEKGGALISEYPENHKPRKVEFLERNRIVAALSDAVIIPEAAGNSGSLNTARHAIEMGIPVFAVPGNITSPMSEGTNYLLKTEAKAVTDASDILKALGINSNLNQQKLELYGDNEQETLILQKISKGINESSSLQIETKLDTVEFQTHLSMLEIQGRISQDSQGNWQLK